MIAARHKGEAKVCAGGADLLAVGMADPQDAHVPVERMREVVTKFDVFLTDAEQEHLSHCLECLQTFSALVHDRHHYDESSSGQ